MVHKIVSQKYRSIIDSSPTQVPGIAWIQFNLKSVNHTLHVVDKKSNWCPQNKTCNYLLRINYVDAFSMLPGSYLVTMVTIVFVDAPIQINLILQSLQSEQLCIYCIWGQCKSTSKMKFVYNITVGTPNRMILYRNTKTIYYITLLAKCQMKA